MRKLTVTPNTTERILGFIYLAVETLILSSGLWMVNLFLGNPLTEVQLNFLYFFLNFLFTTLILHRFLIDCGKIALSAPLRCICTAFTGLFLTWLSNMFLGILITVLSPEFYNVNDDSIAGLLRENHTLMAIGIILLAPVAEELLFRGLIFGSLYNRSSILAYAVCSLTFAGLHVVGYIGQYQPVHLLLCLVQYLPPALILCWVYARSQTIWSPILLHIIINLIAISSMR